MKITNEYPNSHHYIEEWEKTEYHCLECGATSVWQESESAGDYYVGECYMCSACGFTFTWQTSGKKNDIQIQLKTGIQLLPTTPLGH